MRMNGAKIYGFLKHFIMFHVIEATKDESNPSIW